MVGRVYQGQLHAEACNMVDWAQPDWPLWEVMLKTSLIRLDDAKGNADGIAKSNV
jgi:hypothetical protein